MSTTKKVAPVVPKKTSTPRKKVLSANEFTPLVEKSVTAPKTDKKSSPKKRVTRSNNSKTVAMSAKKAPILTEVERKHLQPRHIQVVQNLVALPRLTLSEKSVTVIGILSRSIGVFIACVGIGYSLIGSNILSGALNQSANLVAVATSTIMQIDCTESINFTNIACARLIKKEPAANITMRGDRTNLCGQVPVEIYVPFAEYVKMKITSTAGVPVTSWVPMVNISDGNFEHTLDVSNLKPGIYKLLFYIRNFYGGYEQFDQDTFTVTAYIPTTTSVTIPVAPPQITGVVANLNESSDYFQFSIDTLHVDTVTLSAIELATKKTFLIGDAVQDQKDKWGRVWKFNPATPNGEYRIQVKAVAGSDTIVYDSLTVTKIPLTGARLAESANEVIETTELKPPVTISILAPTPLRGMVGVSIAVAHASSVALEIQPKNSLRYNPLGRAVQSNATTWVYAIDSSMFPDGEYTIRANVRNSYGDYSVAKPGLLFQNVVKKTFTDEEAAHIKTLETVVAVAEPNTQQPTTPINRPTAPNPSEPQLPPALVTESGSEPSIRINTALEQRLRLELDKLSVSLRLEDTDAINRITEQINSLKTDVAAESVNTASAVDEYIARRVSKTKADVALANNLITERTKQKAAQDSDQDKISDYDEVRLYGTNPFVADTDNDGFLDGVEVQNGYDPLDATPEALVSHESPKEAGVVREDILQIKSITTAPAGEQVATTTEPRTAAILSGYALPNSFITLYIFSTPVIVTIKTDIDGSWNYRLDKELEDGEHEVYIGVTDNAGKIVAKSAPFAFIKEAEAFTGVVVDTPAAIQTTQSDSLFSEYAVYLVLGISTVAIGIILMLLGLQLRGRKDLTLTDAL